MKKTAVIYWSAGGNTEIMANKIADCIRSAGAEAELFTVSEFGNRNIDDYDGLALGCPAMGAEVLEESEFEPFLTSIESELAGRKVAIFGSFGWGDGEWMRSWEKRMKDDCCRLFEKGLMINLTPDSDGEKECFDFGARFAKF